MDSNNGSDKKPPYLSRSAWGDYAEIMCAAAFTLRGMAVARSMTSQGPIDIWVTNLATSETKLYDVKSVTIVNNVPRLLYKESEAQKKFPGKIHFITYYQGQVWTAEELVAAFPAEVKKTARQERLDRRTDEIINGLRKIGPEGVPATSKGVAKASSLTRDKLKIFGTQAELLKHLESTGEVVLIRRDKKKTLIHREFR